MRHIVCAVFAPLTLTSAGSAEDESALTIYRHGYVGSIADAQGVKTANADFPFGTQCVLSPGGTVKPLGSTKFGRLFAHDGKNARPTQEVYRFETTGIRVSQVRKVPDSTRVACPSALLNVSILAARDIIEWYLYQNSLEKASGK